MDATRTTQTPVNPTAEAFRAFLHPASGLLILGADWFYFSGAVFSLGGLLIHVMVLGFLTGLLGVAYIQRCIARESWHHAVLKGLIAGVFVGFPIPIGGTIIGGLILACSGLDVLRQQAARVLAEKTAESPTDAPAPAEGDAHGKNAGAQT